ncbi:hypothetical protein L2E82_26538 [Cichorium intybus]|uniref:Uncharacterized protein n=1 Tax=Cichorium intybus TaxID=13427 RepID=A0ACB9CQP8_CICIN|nr:hypothetical protein L2E82_26538 [Cichorium intybus]
MVPSFPLLLQLNEVQTTIAIAIPSYNIGSQDCRNFTPNSIGHRGCSAQPWHPRSLTALYLSRSLNVEIEPGFHKLQNSKPSQSCRRAQSSLPPLAPVAAIAV